MLVLAGLRYGSVSLSWAELVEAWEHAGPALHIVLEVRLPRVVGAVLVGMALAVAGVLLQAFFQNPLADSSVLGVSSGAGAGVAAVILLGGGSWTGLGWSLSGYGAVVVAAALGAAVVLALLLVLAARLPGQLSLLVAGVMLGYIVYALVSLWQYFSHPEALQAYLLWTVGSLGGITRAHLPVLALVITAGLLMALAAAKALNIWVLGEDYARSLGLNMGRWRIWLLVSASLLTGSAVAFCGLIGFVGLAVPQLVRHWLRTDDHWVLIPAAALGGANLLLVCSLIAHVGMPGGTILPLNSLTTLLGAPVVLWILSRRRTS